jgi:ComF family protein
LGAVAHYDDVMIKTIIHLCKYQKMHGLTDVCSNMLVEYINNLNPQPSLLSTNPLVIPIPLHPKKERERGFNQSALIAQKFAHAKNLSYAEPLIKTRYDDPQARVKTHTERFNRIHKAFAIGDPNQVQNKNIILIDDVSTSGATLSEAAQILKAAGARQILALVIAKA